MIMYIINRKGNDAKHMSIVSKMESIKDAKRGTMAREREKVWTTRNEKKRNHFFACGSGVLRLYFCFIF